MLKTKMWEHKRFLSLSRDAKLLWLYLVTPRRGAVPGLLLGGPALYAEAVRFEYDETVVAMEELRRVKLIEIDGECRLIRILDPNTWGLVVGTHPNVVRGWWSAWGELPESKLKYDHIETLLTALGGGRTNVQGGSHTDHPWLDSVWPTTFGTVDVRDYNVGCIYPAQLELLSVEESQGVKSFERVRRATSNSKQRTTSSLSLVAQKVQGGSDPKPSRGRAPPSDEAKELARYLAEAIHSHTPDFSASPPASWAPWFDRSLRKGRVPDRIRDVIDHCHRNEADTFWRPNILSGRKLHEQWDQLWIRYQQQTKLRVVKDVRTGRVEPHPPSAFGEGGEVDI